jgi:hydrogenase nickel incorporation protein HypB
MCNTCGCSVSPEAIRISDATGTLSLRPAAPQSIDLVHGILDENDRIAAHVRDHLAEHGVLAVNLMSSPGAGKTALLEATIDALKGRYRIGVIEGDLETENDANRIRARGVPALQIITGSTCHLDAAMIHDALHGFDLSQIDILFIENVGNLVCPAGFDLGQRANVVLLSATEGQDKPAKYPVMFRAADLVLITKGDRIPLLGDFDPESARGHVRDLARDVAMPVVSVRQPASLKPWLDWLEVLRAEALFAAGSRRPAHRALPMIGA